jgi:hypothetical protein
MKTFLLSFLSILFLTIPSVEAQTESQAAAQFLLIEPGARATGLGEAYVALAEDATASYFNPAALAGQSAKSLTFTHTKWLPALANDLFYEFIGYALPVEGWGNFGVNVAFLSLGKQIRTDERGNILGEFSSYDFAVDFSYGAYLSRKSAAGIGMKIIRSNLADVGAGIEKGKGVGTTFAIDIGYLYRSPSGLRFGAALRNLGPKITYIDADQADMLPQHLVFGAAYRVLDTQYNKFLLTADLYKPLVVSRDNSFLAAPIKAWSDQSFKDEVKDMDIHVGGEYQYSLTPDGASFVALRAGYSADRDGDLRFATYGFGLRYSWIQFDVAYLPAQETPLQDNTRFSVNLNF